MATISEALATAVEHHQAGRLQAAEQIYQQILAVDPSHATAWNLLGVVHSQGGNHQVAADCLCRAIGLSANVAAFHNNLGNVYQALTKRDEAIANYRRAIELNPNFAEPHYNLGNVCQAQGKWDEAVASYLRTLELNPVFAEAHYNLGNILREQRKSDEAVVSYGRALELKPNFAEAHNNLGVILQDQGKRNEAAACYSRALELKPDFAEAYGNLGNVLVLLDRGKLKEAVACHRRALELKPDYGAVMCALANELQHLCQWEDLQGLSERVIELVDEESENLIAAPVSPFSFVTLPLTTTAEQQLRCARQWMNRRLKLPVELPRGPAWTRRKDRKAKITVGYLSADFHSHATAQLTAELFEKHDREYFFIIGYSFCRDDFSPMRRRLIKAFDRFVDLKDTSFMEAAERIAADEVDVAVDLNGYTTNSRAEILSLRPAPIQVNYLGYPGTMGASFMDYILVDDFVVPPEQQPYYTEKLVHLPGCYQVNDRQREISPRTPSRAECGLPPEGLVFCCFNNNYKITPEVFGVWMKLLHAVPGSVLWLLEGNRFAPSNLRREAEARGIAAERLIFAPRLPLADHLARHGQADLFLDTFPVNAHTTASEALWAGCPVLTIAGETFVSRVAGSLLRTLGLPELIAANLSEYEGLALWLANDPKQLADLRTRLQTSKSTSALFDGAEFARNLEKAYVTMWEIYASGEKPRSFRVNRA